MRLIDAEYALATSISGLIRTIEGEPWIRVKEVRDSLKNIPTFDIDNIIAEHESIGYEKGFRDGYAEAVDFVYKVLSMIQKSIQDALIVEQRLEGAEE